MIYKSTYEGAKQIAPDLPQFSQSVRLNAVRLAWHLQARSALTPGDRDGAPRPLDGINHASGQSQRTPNLTGPDHGTDRE